MKILAQGSGISLAPLAEVDPANIVRELNDFEVSRWLTRVPYPYTIADAYEFQERFSEDPQVRAIMAPEGFAGVVGTENGLGYWVAQRFWGRGYGPEAARRMVARYFLSPSMAELRSGYLDGNIRSKELLLRLGFQEVGEDVVVPAATRLESRLKRLILKRDDFWAGLGMTVVTPRLTLRPMAPEDASELTRIVTQEQVARMLFIFRTDWDDAAAFIEDWAYNGRLRFRLAIEVEGRFVGTIGVGDGIAPPVFYFLDPEVAGRGVATEVLQAFASFVFKRFGVEALTAEVFEDNPASSRVLKKTGFREVGRGMGTSAARLEPAPDVHYRLERKDFIAG